MEGGRSGSLSAMTTHDASSPRRAFYPCCATDVTEPLHLLRGFAEEVVFCDLNTSLRERWNKRVALTAEGNLVRCFWWRTCEPPSRKSTELMFCFTGATAMERVVAASSVSETHFFHGFFCAFLNTADTSYSQTVRMPWQQLQTHDKSGSDKARLALPEGVRATFSGTARSLCDFRQSAGRDAAADESL